MSSRAEPIDFPRLRDPWSNISLVGGWDPDLVELELRDVCPREASVAGVAIAGFVAVAAIAAAAGGARRRPSSAAVVERRIAAWSAGLEIAAAGRPGGGELRRNVPGVAGVDLVELELRRVSREASVAGVAIAGGAAVAAIVAAAAASC